MHISQKWRLDDLSIPRNWKQSLELFLKEQDLVKAIEKFQALHADYRQFSSYANCLFSENIENEEAKRLIGESLQFEAELQKAGIIFDKKLLQITDFEPIGKIAFLLKMRRENAQEKMTDEKESLATDLALHGYHSWNELYKETISGLKINGVSFNQIDNLLSKPDREERKRAFIALEGTCRQHEQIFAKALTSLIGFRMALYKNRGWKNPIHEALRNNYMEQKTLDVMWKNVQAAAPIFHRFLDEKAKIFGLKKLSWYDFEAPYPNVDSKFSYENGCNILVELFNNVNPEIGAFTEKCLKSKVEAEDRPKKAPGGFCTPFPLAKESRIYMNYNGSINSLLVLAHELGHAYHDHVCFDLPELAQHYPSSVAETASTTCELITLDGLIAKAATKEEKKWLYYEKAHRSTTFFLNIHARFLFEQQLFREEYCDASKLCEMMVRAQKEAYGDRLETYHPYFWITKQHFYLTDIPSYNFPYTFGYLLSQAINARMKREPDWFTTKYNSFLQDTGIMSVEELVKKHFNQDIQDDQCWQQAIENAKRDLEEYFAL
ncbi:MAG: M3 family oligoendopeptidase [Verrucomicrobia bacterium]|nr:M3 family oligoendopeptidase [Verrucomicrobiota bacterium]